MAFTCFVFFDLFNALSCRSQVSRDGPAPSPAPVDRDTVPLPLYKPLAEFWGEGCRNEPSCPQWLLVQHLLSCPGASV